MQILQSKKQFSDLLNNLRLQGNSIGFVPTMGALHEGHISLMKKCRSENNIATASIFVNPTQFNDRNDLKNYPRMPEKDIEILKNAGCDIVFTPEVEEMYPVPDNRVFNFGYLESVMEGKHRPGHFNGVAQIVTKLFDIVGPHNSYFGEKDFQQLTIIKHLVLTLNLPVKVVPCSIVREPDGLAMSSRNLLLGKEERKAAPLISKTLFKATDIYKEYSVSEIKNWVINQIDESNFLKTEYFEIVDDIELKPILSWEEKNNKVGCIAVKAGHIRLIDNVRF